MEPTKISAKDVAVFFILKSDVEIGDIITNLKLQKLVYYAQGFHLAMFDKPFFREPIVNWTHGPVVEELYHDFKRFGSGPIVVDHDFNIDLFSTDQLELLDEVNSVYGQFSAWKLRDMTHSERPWVETGPNEVIPHGLLRDFFQNYLIAS